MTVAELIELLKVEDPERVVIVWGPNGEGSNDCPLSGLTSGDFVPRHSPPEEGFQTGFLPDMRKRERLPPKPALLLS